MDLLDPSAMYVVSTVPVAVIWPVQLMVAFMPFGLRVTSEIWQSLRGGVGLGPPYLSIIAWVTQTCVVWGPPMGLAADGIWAD